MELRVKELLKEKGLRMSDLADRMGTNQSNLQKSLAKNPTIATLQDVADALNVQLGELFPASVMIPTAKSLMIMDGKTYGIVPMQNIVNIPHYTYFPQLHEVVKKFVFDSLQNNATDSICGLLDAFELFCLSYDRHNRVFILAICYENAKMKTICYDVIEFSDGSDNVNVEQLLNEVLNDITGAISVRQG
jgi:transcriptional regulator with XRE-family HTH domain